MDRPPLSPLVARVALAAALALAGCGGERRPAATCSIANQKAGVLAVTQDWYLYPDLLPSPAPSAASFGTAEALLAKLTETAVAQGKDRGWSFLSTGQQSQQFYGDGQTVGYGLGLVVRGTAPDQQLLVREAIAGGPAAEAGFARGDEILAIGLREQELLPVGPLLAPATSADPSLGQLLASSVENTTRVFQVRSAGSSEGVLRTVTTRVYGLDPVPVVAVGGNATRWFIHEPAEGSRVGYVLLRTFIGPAEAPLREAFAHFKAAGVANVVIDVRYNGGGLVSIAETLANLLGGKRSGSDPMFTFQLNARHAAQSETRRFAAQPESIPATRITFVTTGSSASASELVPSVLAAYPDLDVRIVGARSHGKPVGQRLFDLGTCDSLLFLVSFKLVNAAGYGDYFEGLPTPSVGGTLCAADDDLGHLPGDAAEAMTAAAVQVAATGICPAPAAPAGIAAKRLAVAAKESSLPAAPQPTLAQRELPGLF
jgi:carboxyl-terminal processing protease